LGASDVAIGAMGPLTRSSRVSKKCYDADGGDLEDSVHDERENGLARELVERLAYEGARKKWYSQPGTPSRQMNLTAEERRWLARHLRHQRKTQLINPLEVRRDDWESDAFGSATRKWEEEPWIRPSRRLGLTREERGVLARYLRWQRSGPEVASADVRRRLVEERRTGRHDPELPEFVILHRELRGRR
jgi:hypothetical protein